MDVFSKDYFISPITGYILAKHNYVPFGNRQGHAIPSPIVMDHDIEIKKIKEDIILLKSFHGLPAGVGRNTDMSKILHISNYDKDIGAVESSNIRISHDINLLTRDFVKFKEEIILHVHKEIMRLDNRINNIKKNLLKDLLNSKSSVS